MTFTRENYMQGKKPPPSAPIIEWKYGVAQSKKGKLRAFWSRGQLSQTNILVLKTMEAPEDSTLPREKAEELLLKGFTIDVVGQYTDAMSSETRTALTKAVSDLNEALTLVRTEIRTLESNRLAYPKIG